METQIVAFLDYELPLWAWFLLLVWLYGGITLVGFWFKARARALRRRRALEALGYKFTDD